MSGYVYIIHNGQGKYKIGYTNGELRKRLLQLQTASPERLYVEMIIKSDQPLILEKEFHDLFSQKRIHGEWFNLDEIDLINIEYRGGVRCSFYQKLEDTYQNSKANKDDIASMEHPIFSLSTKPDMRVLHYENNGNTITIKPSNYGLATIHDKDILLYCASYLRAAMNEGKTHNRTVRFTVYDFFVSTNRLTNGRNYQLFKTALNRLRGTTINTNIKTGGLTIEEGFGIIDAWRAVKEDKSGRVIAAEIKVSEWFYNAVLTNELLTINPDYFRLRMPIERRVYEMARKHCGERPFFKIGLDKLKKTVGSSSTSREFRRIIGKIILNNHLPDYEITQSEDIITFNNRHWKIPAELAQSAFSFLKPETYEKARAAAPGSDIHTMAEQWRAWITKKKEPPKRPNAAFCRKKFQQESALSCRENLSEL
ncbi:MAG TPA: replication initiator protein A [Candidatus Competibacteraceae bacterium]|nr:replication initiator protein A [Candidatus Competibacteraceae bacterium]